MNKLLLAPLIAFPWLGYAQTTTIEVPQGSGVLPTVGQVNCLEELGSGGSARPPTSVPRVPAGFGRIWRTTMGGEQSAKIRQWQGGAIARSPSMAALPCGG